MHHQEHYTWPIYPTVDQFSTYHLENHSAQSLNDCCNWLCTTLCGTSVLFVFESPQGHRDADELPVHRSGASAMGVFRSVAVYVNSHCSDKCIAED